MKKNIAKNGLVSNLACQFEPKENIAMNDVSNVDHGQPLPSQQQQPQRLMKPPIPPTTAKLSKDNQQYDLLNADYQRHKYHTINLSRGCSTQE